MGRWAKGWSWQRHKPGNQSVRRRRRGPCQRRHVTRGKQNNGARLATLRLKRKDEPFFISPLEVHFAHDSISSDFRAPFKNILDTLTDLAKGSLSQQEVECIDIVWSEDIPWRAGLLAGSRRSEVRESLHEANIASLC